MMSPAKRLGPSSKLDDAELRRLYKRHYVSYFNGGKVNWIPTKFSRLVGVVDKFADEVAALRDAMRDPFAPGAAKQIARIGKIIGTHSNCDGAGRITHHDSDIETYGEAIGWHVRGEPVEEVEAEQERVEAIRAKDDYDHRPRQERTQEELERGRDLHLGHALRALVRVLCCEGSSFSIKKNGGGFLTIAESSSKKRREALAWLRRELLGEGSPTITCRVCGVKDRWPEDIWTSAWPAPDICHDCERAAKVVK